MMPGRRRAPGLRRTSVPNACPRDVPEPPSTASDRHQQQPVNLQLAQALKPRATRGNTLVMRGSLDGTRIRPPRARHVPDRTANRGIWRSITDAWIDAGPTIGQVTDQAEHP